MGFGLSFGLFFIITIFYVVIIDLFTMLFRITGLTQEKARFQVISLLTNSGYSTKESELVVDVLSRRRLARTIMLFGYVFSITIVSVFINAMMALPTSEKEEVWPTLIIVGALFLIFILLRRVPVVKLAFDGILEQLGRKWLYGSQENLILLQEEFPRGVIAEVTLNRMPPGLAGKTLAALDLPALYGIHVLYIRRNGFVLIDIDDKDTQLQLQDAVVVYGTMRNIRRVFESEPTQENDLKQAARPETEQAYLHEQDLKNADRAAHAQHAKETAQERSENVDSLTQEDRGTFVATVAQAAASLEQTAAQTISAAADAKATAASTAEAAKTAATLARAAAQAEKSAVSLEQAAGPSEDEAASTKTNTPESQRRSMGT